MEPVPTRLQTQVHAMTQPPAGDLWGAAHSFRIRNAPAARKPMPVSSGVKL